APDIRLPSRAPVPASRTYPRRVAASRPAARFPRESPAHPRNAYSERQPRPEESASLAGPQSVRQAIMALRSPAATTLLLAEPTAVQSRLSRLPATSRTPARGNRFFHAG